MGYVRILIPVKVFFYTIFLCIYVVKELRQITAQQFLKTKVDKQCYICNVEIFTPLLKNKYLDIPSAQIKNINNR